VSIAQAVDANTKPMLDARESFKENLAVPGDSHWARREPTSRTFFAAMWIVNMAALAAITCWILRDGRFADAAVRLAGQLRSLLHGATAANPTGTVGTRLLMLKLMVGAGIGSMFGMLLGLFVGPAAHRQIRTWLAFTAIIVLWLTLFVTWRELAWHAQVWRLSNQPGKFQSVAESLRSNWPKSDGERAELGPFLAYPRDDVRMLMLLGKPASTEGGLPYTAVERATDSTLRFELAGNEEGAWLELHPPGSVPSTFVGGLATQYRLVRAAALGNGWYVTRYQAAGIAGQPLDRVPAKAAAESTLS
jgi:hypothetical protein